MNYIEQRQLVRLRQLVTPGKVVILYGARRVGKTTLVKKYLESEAEPALYVSGDDIFVREFLAGQSIEKLRDFIGQNKLLIVDEAQYIPQIGLNLKLIVDHLPEVMVIATGSSSFDLARDTGEPLTGRRHVLTLYPLAQLELNAVENRAETAARLESRLIYGSYPEVVLLADNRQRAEYLRDLVNSYLTKDILALEGVQHSEKLMRLLQLLVFQIGKELSFTELGAQLGMSKNTVERYLDLLEKAFVIYRRRGFNRNLRKEISKNPRYYFFDNGIRNGLIQNFGPLSLRNDTGELWENYILGERLKKLEYAQQWTSSYFWRTYSRQEIDLVEECDGQLHGYEVKWQPQPARPPREWSAAYPQAEFTVIHREHYLDFIG